MINNCSYILIDAGGTFLKSAVMDGAGSILGNSMSMEEAHSGSSKERIIGSLVNLIRRMMKYIEESGSVISGIGIAFPGPFDYSAGRPLMTHKFENIFGVDLHQEIRAALSLNSEIPLIFRHDANSVLEGEIWKGKASGFNNSALITLGTGLGFACAFDKKVMTNEIGGPYITIFKLPYRDGILEDYASRRGFLRIYSEKMGIQLPSGFDVADIAIQASDGQKEAIDTFYEVGSIIASAIKGILIDNSIECLLFGGQISRSFCFMESGVKSVLSSVGSLKKVSTVSSVETSALTGVMKELLSVKK